MIPIDSTWTALAAALVSVGWASREVVLRLNSNGKKYVTEDKLNLAISVHREECPVSHEVIKAMRGLEDRLTNRLESLQSQIITLVKK